MAAAVLVADAGASGYPRFWRVAPWRCALERGLIRAAGGAAGDARR